MRDLIVNSSITHSLLLVLPVACALLLRWARCPGWAIAGGVCAGILLGPTVLGRVAPDTFERMFVGGGAERAALVAIVDRHGAERLVAATSGVDEETLAERHAVERAEADGVLATARWNFQRPFRSYTAAVAVLALLGAGLVGMPRRAGTPSAGSVVAITIGLWSALVPAALAYAAGTWLFRLAPPTAGLLAAGVAIGPWALTMLDRSAADSAEHGGARTVQAAGRVATLIAVAIALVALLAIGDGRRLAWWAPLLALPIGWTLRPGLGGRVAREILLCAFVPALAACSMLRTDLVAHATLWPIIVIVLLSGDGRWLGAFLGTILPGGRDAGRTMQLASGAMAAGPTQIAVVALAAHTWMLPGPMLLALAAGAVAVEVTWPLRGVLAVRAPG